MAVSVLCTVQTFKDAESTVLKFTVAKVTNKMAHTEDNTHLSIFHDICTISVQIITYIA